MFFSFVVENRADFTFVFVHWKVQNYSPWSRSWDQYFNQSKLGYTLVYVFDSRVMRQTWEGIGKFGRLSKIQKWKLQPKINPKYPKYPKYPKFPTHINLHPTSTNNRNHMKSVFRTVKQINTPEWRGRRDSC